MYLGIRDQGEAGQLSGFLIGSLDGNGRLAGPDQGQPLRQRRDARDQLELRLELCDAPGRRDATLRAGGLGGYLNGDISCCLEAHL
jgi:hypothetical protein